MSETEAPAAEPAAEAPPVEVSDAEIERVKAGEPPAGPPAIVNGVSLTPAMSVDELLARHERIVDVMNRAMKPGVHFGTVPGVSKPALFKPGAELLCVLFQLAPSFPDERQRDLVDEVTQHRDVTSLCVLTHMSSGIQVAEAHGACSTREKKYAYRGGALICPECNEGAVKKGRTRDREHGQYYCHRGTGGCGQNWDEGTDQYEAFEAERKLGQDRIANKDLPDEWNTVLKMSEKRSLVAATLMATAASDVFTQDVEDQPGRRRGEQESSTRPERRQNPPAHPPFPEGWAAMTQKFEENGVEAEWLAQAIIAKFGKPLEELTVEERRTPAWQFMKRCFAAMYEVLGANGKLEFPGPTRAEIRTMFAAVLDGQELAGPAWRIHPPDYDPGEAEYDARWGGDDEDGSAEDIPFGPVQEEEPPSPVSG